MQVVAIDPDDDGSAVVITVARYQTPLGIDINKKGIQPDIKLAEDTIPSGPEICRVLAGGDAPRLFL